jgi:hypothetical protein
LEVSHGEVLVELDGTLVAVDCIPMLAQCGMDDTEVEEDLGCVGDGLEAFETVVEFVVVVSG